MFSCPLCERSWYEILCVRNVWWQAIIIWSQFHPLQRIAESCLRADCVCQMCRFIYDIRVLLAHSTFLHTYICIVIIRPFSCHGFSVFCTVTPNSLWATPFLPSPVSKFTVNDILWQYHATSKTPARKMSPVLSFHKPSFCELWVSKICRTFLTIWFTCKGEWNISQSILFASHFLCHSLAPRKKSVFFCICKSRPHCCFSRVTLPCTSFRFQMWRHSSCAHFERVSENLNSMWRICDRKIS